MEEAARFRQRREGAMHRKVAVAVVLCLAAVALLGIVASPAGAGAGGQPQVGTPDVAYVHLLDAAWFSGVSAWGDNILYPAGTPIPAQDFIIGWQEAINPDRSLVEQFPQIFLVTVTVMAANRDLVVETTEEQSAQFWGPISWDPFNTVPFPMWRRDWQVPLGQLSPGTYQMTYGVHQITAMEFTDPATGQLIILKPWRKSFRSSFTVQ
jgi:hypothetical protein